MDLNIYVRCGHLGCSETIFVCNDNRCLCGKYFCDKHRFESIENYTWLCDLCLNEYEKGI